MKQLKVIILMMLIFQQLAFANKKIPLTYECEVITAVIKDIMKEDSLSEIKVAKKYRKWNIDLNIDFNINSGPFHEPPKDQEERLQRLKTYIADPYTMYYVFAFPFTDTLFTKEDRRFMKNQINSDTTKYFHCKADYIKLVNTKYEGGDAYIFFKPIFSEDLKYAIIMKYTNYDITKDGTIFGESQILYYKHDERQGWIRIFAGGRWQ